MSLIILSGLQLLLVSLGNICCLVKSWRLSSENEARESRVKVYFAGPDVFSRSYGVFKEKVAATCAELALEPLFPGDEVTGMDPAAIFRDNLALIDRADVVVANLNSFRGSEPDSGTVFELGYAYARGKALWGYVDNGETTTERLERLQGALVQDGADILDRDGWKIENFGLKLNLMIAVPVRIIVGPPKSCIESLSRALSH